MNTSRCACPHPDAEACADVRYPPALEAWEGGPDTEPCDCPCHTRDDLLPCGCWAEAGETCLACEGAA